MAHIETIKNRLIAQTNQVYEEKYSAASTDDIVTVIKYVFNKHKNDLDELAQHLRKLSKRQTLQKIWKFVNKIEYRADKARQEFVKSPQMVLRDGYADCKSMSIMVACLLHALGYDFVFRFSGMNYYPDGTPNKDKNVTHIYVVAILYNTEVVLDATLDYFDYEAPSDFSYDYAPDSSIVQIGNRPSFVPSPLVKNVVKASVAGAVIYGICKFFSNRNQPENAN